MSLRFSPPYVFLSRGKRLHKKRAPVAVAVCLIAYCCMLGGTVLTTSDYSVVGKMMAVVVFVGIAAVTIAVLVERIREIDGGEEDDLGKY